MMARSNVARRWSTLANAISTARSRESNPSMRDSRRSSRVFTSARKSPTRASTFPLTIVTMAITVARAMPLRVRRSVGHAHRQQRSTAGPLLRSGLDAAPTLSGGPFGGPGRRDAVLIRPTVDAARRPAARWREHERRATRFPPSECTVARGRQPLRSPPLRFDPSVTAATDRAGSLLPGQPQRLARSSHTNNCATPLSR